MKAKFWSAACLAAVMILLAAQWALSAQSGTPQPIIPPAPITVVPVGTFAAPNISADRLYSVLVRRVNELGGPPTDTTRRVQVRLILMNLSDQPLPLSGSSFVLGDAAGNFYQPLTNGNTSTPQLMRRAVPAGDDLTGIIRFDVPRTVPVTELTVYWCPVADECTSPLSAPIGFAAQ